MCKTRCSAVAFGVLAFVLVAGAFPERACAADHDPVLFVHGYGGSANCWNTMIERFKADGWTDGELFAITYDYTQSNVTTAALIKEKVDAILAQTGASKVDIVTHSMGAHSTRYYIKFLGGDGTVDAWVSLGGSNHGCRMAYLFTTAAAREMRPGSAFLKKLNADDETPGDVSYATWWSPCDEVIYPRKSVILDGATNTRTSCMAHNALLYSKTVYTQVRDWVAP